jgi:hypothetical protein
MKGKERNVSQKFFLKTFVLEKFQVLHMTRKLGPGVSLSKGEVNQIQLNIFCVVN